MCVSLLDVHKYHNCDKLQVELEGTGCEKKSIKHTQDGNNIKILSADESLDKNITCNIAVPVKASKFLQEYQMIRVKF